MMTALLSNRTSAAAPTDAIIIAMSINRSFMTTPVFLSSMLKVSAACIYYLITNSCVFHTKPIADKYVFIRTGRVSFDTLTLSSISSNNDQRKYKKYS
jgi:hypothetical protein